MQHIRIICCTEESVTLITLCRALLSDSLQPPLAVSPARKFFFPTPLHVFTIEHFLKHFDIISLTNYILIFTICFGVTQNQTLGLFSHLQVKN